MTPGPSFDTSTWLFGVYFHGRAALRRLMKVARNRRGVVEMTTFMFLVYPFTMMVFDPIQIGVTVLHRLVVEHAATNGARRAGSEGGEDASVDYVVTQTLGSAGLPTSGPNVQWGVYTDATCQTSVPAGSVPWNTIVVFCLKYQEPADYFGLSNGTAVWLLKRPINVEVGT